MPREPPPAGHRSAHATENSGGGDVFEITVGLSESVSRNHPLLEELRRLGAQLTFPTPAKASQFKNHLDHSTTALEFYLSPDPQGRSHFLLKCRPAPK